MIIPSGDMPYVFPVLVKFVIVVLSGRWIYTGMVNVHLNHCGGTAVFEINLRWTRVCELGSCPALQLVI